MRWFPGYTIRKLLDEPMCVVAYLHYFALKYENREIDIKEIQQLTSTATVMGGFGGAG